MNHLPPPPDLPPPPAPIEDREPVTTVAEAVRLDIASLMIDDTRKPADLRVFGAVAVIAVGFDIWANQRTTALSGTIFFVLTSIALLASGRLLTRQSRVLVALVPFFSVWLSIRTSQWLIPFDFLASVGLLGLGIATSTDGGLTRYGLRDLLKMPLHLAHQGLDGVGFVRRALPADQTGPTRDRLRGVAVGAAISLPILLTLGGLLASGDQAFADLLSRLGSGSWSRWALLLAVGAVIGLALVRATSGSDARPSDPVAPFIGPVETATVLAAMVGLYALYATAQVVGSLDPGTEVLQTARETRSWVHRGFFPLLWASAITLGTLLLLHAVGTRTTRRHHQWFAWLSSAVVGLTLVMVAVAVHRIAGYSDTFGLTMLRLYSLLFACWIGVVFVLFAVRAARFAAHVNWFPTTAAASGLALLFALNVANPEAIVVRYDTEDLARFDGNYLVDWLSDDAIPPFIDALPDLPDERAQQLTLKLCRKDRDGHKGGLEWNRSRAAAQDALDELCQPGD